MDLSVRSLSRWVYLQLEMVRHIPNMSGGESAKSHQDKEIQNMHGFQNRISDKQTVLRLKLFFWALRSMTGLFKVITNLLTWQYTLLIQHIASVVRYGWCWLENISCVGVSRAFATRRNAMVKYAVCTLRIVSPTLFGLGSLLLGIRVKIFCPHPTINRSFLFLSSFYRWYNSSIVWCIAALFV